MARDEMMKSVEDFKRNAAAKKEELHARHVKAMREILEVRDNELLGDVLSDELCYIRGRESWLATWWSDIFGPKAKDRKKCYGNLGKKALCGNDGDILLYLLIDGDEICCIPIKEVNPGKRYEERPPLVRTVEFRDPATLDFACFCSPEEVTAQLKAYKSYCTMFEGAFRHIHEIVKRMRAYELKRQTEKTNELSKSLEGL